MPDHSRFPLPTDTAHVRIESRQYRIFKFDLGEGVARWKAGVAAVLVTPYWLLLLVLGVSPLAGHGRGGLLYLFPAVLLVWAALRPDAGGRPRYALWLDRGRFLHRRDAPMIAGPIANTTPARPFIVSAEWVVISHRTGRTRRREGHPANRTPNRTAKDTR